jgi:hypothetical protein
MKFFATGYAPMQPTKLAPHGRSDPTPAEIEQRCAAIRRRWSAATERERRVQHVEPVVYWPVAVEDIGLEWQSMSL